MEQGDLRDCEGFRLFSHNGITSVMLLRKDGKRSGMLPLSLLEEPMVLAEWLESHLPSLDLADLERERQLLIAQHTSEQPDIVLAIHRVRRWENRVLLWPMIGLVTAAVTRTAPVPYRDALSSLFAWVNLAMLTMMIADMARHRRLVLITADRVQQRPQAMALIWPLLAIFAQSMFYHPISHVPREIALGLALTIGIVLAGLPGAPEVTLLQRVVLGAGVSFLALPLLFTLNVVLAPMPVHEIHTARVTEIEPSSKRKEIVNWSYDEPVGGVTIGWESQPEGSAAVGDRLSVEVARGGLGWYWLVKTSRLPDTRP